MPGELSLVFAGVIFVLSVSVVIGLGLFVITVVLRIQAKYRKRLARVSQRRLSGRIDFDEARLTLARHGKDVNTLETLTQGLAKFIPLLDTTRLKANFNRAGLGISVPTFVVISLAVGIAIGFGAYAASNWPAPTLVLPSLFGGMYVVDNVVKFLGNRMSNKFMKQLPDALDTIIRGIRSGLPVIECIASVGEEYDEPIGTHFRAISERVRLGESLDVALWNVARVIDRPEMDFLAVCISIQIETGGSLAEALNNLADLLRQRERMKLKIAAISSEAKASALIIGALPFVLLGLLSVMSPEYVMPLFQDPRGQKMLLMGLGSITVGAFVMWRMTQFEI